MDKITGRLTPRKTSPDIFNESMFIGSGKEDTNGAVNRTQADVNDEQRGTQSLDREELDSKADQNARRVSFSESH